MSFLPPLQGNLATLRDVRLATPEDGEVLTYSGGVWINAVAGSVGGGSGTVTSVGLVVPGVLFDPAAIGGPITGAGSLTLVLKSQAANRVLASPDGTAGSPAFRALTANDLPASIPAARISGVVASATTAASLTGSIAESQVAGLTADLAILATAVATKADDATVVHTAGAGTVFLAPTGSGAQLTGIDHGALSGLADDDHTQYHTDARAVAWLGTRSTSDLPEGSNLYHTPTRVNTLIASAVGVSVQARSATLDTLAGATYATGTLLGGGGTGVPASIAVGTGLSLAGGTLSATGGGGGSGAGTGEPFVTFGSSAGLSNERVLTEGTGVTITDAGTDGGPITVAIGQAVGTSDSPGFAGLSVGGAAGLNAAGTHKARFGEAEAVDGFGLWVGQEAPYSSDKASFLSDGQSATFGARGFNTVSFKIDNVPYYKFETRGAWFFTPDASRDTTAGLSLSSKFLDWKALVLQALAGQTGPLLEVQDSAGATLSRVRSDGSLQPRTLADAAAANDSLYYSSTQSALAYKDGSGSITTMGGGGSGGSGTVTSVSVVAANGVSGSVATATTTPAITLTLGDITPSSVAATSTVTGSNLSGTNTGDQTITLTGDVTGTGTGSFVATIGAGKVTAAMLAGSIPASLLVGTDLAITQGQVAGLESDLSALSASIATKADQTGLDSLSDAVAAKAPIDSPAFTGTVTIGSLGGLLKGTAGAVSAAVEGTDYLSGASSTLPLPYSVGGTGTPTVGTDKVRFHRIAFDAAALRLDLACQTAPTGGAFAVTIKRSGDGGATFPDTVASVSVADGGRSGTTAAFTTATFAAGDVLRLDIDSVNGAADWGCRLTTLSGNQ